MKRNTIVEIISSLLILLFLYTAVSKLIDFTRFTGEMNNQPLPNWMTPFLTWMIPVLEILAAGLLMVAKTRVKGLYLSLALMSLFTIYTGLVLFHFFDRVPCSCGGIVKELSWSEHLVLNLFFTGLSLVGIHLCRKNKTKKHYSQAVVMG